MPERITAIVGLGVIIAGAFLLSSNRRSVHWRQIAWGFGLQFVFALIILKTGFGRAIFEGFNDLLMAILQSTEAGARFVFGNLVESEFPVVERVAGGSLEEHSSYVVRTGAYFAFRVLPTIIFFSSLMAILYHIGFMQKIVGALAWIMSRTMKTSGSESLAASANVFIGMVEAPLSVKPFINRMTRSELMAVMTAGFATIAGGVMAAFVAILKDQVPDIAGHLLAASVMSAPAALALAKIMVPEQEESSDRDIQSISNEEHTNVIDAAASGAASGMQIAISVVAMLVAFLALLALMNSFLGWVGAFFGYGDLTLSFLLGKLLAPLALLIGIPWEEAGHIGDLLGTKILINEFVAFLNLQSYGASGLISERTMIIASYALCGFANIGAIGIQIGGLGVIAPKRRSELSSIGPRAMIAGALASCCSACFAAILL